MGEKLRSFMHRMRKVVLLTVRKAVDPYFSGNSAEVAFFLLLSIVPAVLILAQVLNLFDLSVDVIKNLIVEYTNEDLAHILVPLLSYRSSGALSVALVLLALWSGSKAIFSLIRITNYAYAGRRAGRNPLAGYIKDRARAIITVLIIIFTLTFAIGTLMFGELIIEATVTYVNYYLGQEYDINDIWLGIRWLPGFVMYFFMVMSIYYLLPSSGNRYMQLMDREHKWKSVKRITAMWLTNSKRTLKVIFPGSIFASIGMIIATWIYSLYLNQISTLNFNILYGSLGAAVLLLLWFYILAVVLIIGIQINAVWAETKHGDTAV